MPFAPGSPPAGVSTTPTPPNMGGWAGLAGAIAALAEAGVLVAVASAVYKVAQALYWVAFVGEQTAAAVKTVANTELFMSSVLGVFAGVINAAKSAADKALSAVKAVLNALKNVSLARIWRWLMKAWDYYKRFRKWYRDHMQGPIDRMRRNLQEIYNRFFRPILQILDKVRVMTRVLGIFFPKLARAIDRKIFALEARLLAPWSAAIRRLNALSSWATALMTRSGLIDRDINIFTQARDWKSLWKVLLNNGHFPSAGATRAAGADLAQMQDDFNAYMSTGGGPFADRLDTLQQQWDDIKSVLG